jgi:hypothetical protein
MKAGKVEPLEYTKRHGYLTAQYAVRDVYDALVELITNSDDSYGRLGKEKGTMLVEIVRRMKGLSSLVVKDRAEGMTLQEMRKKIRKVGDLTSTDGDRGFMARGAKDCAVLGKVTFESIKEERYHKCEVLPTMDFVPYEPSEKASPQIRKRLGIQRGNGTVVTLEVSDKIVRIPQFETLLNQLPRHYALRDILHSQHGCAAKLRDARSNIERRLNNFLEPEGKVMIDEEFEVPEYPSIRAHLTILKSEKRLDDPPDKRFRRSGLLVKGKRAIHEIAFFKPEIEHEPYSAFYFGKLTCPYIDTLCIEYDKRREQGQPHSESNPSLLVDPSRQAGLRKEHPFTKALYQVPIERLHTLISQDKAREQQREIQIENEFTKQRLDKLAKAASKFIRDKIEDVSDFMSRGDETDSGTYGKQGTILIPTYYTLALGEIKPFYFRVKRPSVGLPEDVAKVNCEGEGIRLLTKEFPLKPSVHNEDLLSGTFQVEGVALTNAASLSVLYNGLPPTEALVSVVESKSPNFIDVPNGLAFDREHYFVREGRTRRLLLRAEYPAVVSEITTIQVISSSENIPVIKPQCRLFPVSGSNYAEGYITVQGRRLNERGTITARVDQRTCEATIEVTQTPSVGFPIRILIRDMSYGNFRAMWDRPENPNHLLISAQHESVRRYLGASPEFEGQNAPYFKILLAEIVSESVCRRVLEELAQLSPWEYEGLNMAGFYAQHNRFMKEFTPIAHSTQLSGKELEDLKKD